MDKQQLEAIRARDELSHCNDVRGEFDAVYNAARRDRRALLAAYDALAAENAALRKAVKGFLDDYVSADGMYDTKHYAREFLSAMEQNHE